MAADRIDILDLRVFCTIGVYKVERVRKQEVRISISLWTDIRRAADTDSVTDTVDYYEVVTRVRDLVEGTTRHTVEALATDIARDICLVGGAVERVRVQVLKPGAIPQAEAAGIEIERTPADFA